MNYDATPYLSNDLFILYADIVFNVVVQNTTFYEMIENGVSIKKNKYLVIFINSLIFSNYIYLLFQLNVPYILITTCNDDICMPDLKYISEYTQLLEMNMLVMWYTKNPCVSNPKIMPIPIGPKWQHNSWHFFGEDKSPIIKVLNQFCLTPLEHFKNKTLKTNLLYFNFSLGTTDNPFTISHKNIRRKIENELLTNGFSKNKNENFEEYLACLTTHKYCISPPGRGIDTHRTWECLMVGTIPIVLSSPLDILFQNLPIIIVNDYSIITEQYLLNKYDEIHTKNYDFSIVYANYWKNKLSC
jgi:hypothetical protein